MAAKKAPAANMVKIPASSGLATAATMDEDSLNLSGISVAGSDGAQGATIAEDSNIAAILADFRLSSQGDIKTANEGFQTSLQQHVGTMLHNYDRNI